MNGKEFINNLIQVSKEGTVEECVKEARGILGDYEKDYVNELQARKYDIRGIEDLFKEKSVGEKFRELMNMLMAQSTNAKFFGNN